MGKAFSKSSRRSRLKPVQCSDGFEYSAEHADIDQTLTQSTLESVVSTIDSRPWFFESDSEGVYTVTPYPEEGTAARLLDRDSLVDSDGTLSLCGSLASLNLQNNCPPGSQCMEEENNDKRSLEVEQTPPTKDDLFSLREERDRAGLSRTPLVVAVCDPQPTNKDKSGKEIELLIAQVAVSNSVLMIEAPDACQLSSAFPEAITKGKPSSKAELEDNTASRPLESHLVVSPPPAPSQVLVLGSTKDEGTSEEAVTEDRSSEEKGTADRSSEEKVTEEDLSEEKGVEDCSFVEKGTENHSEEVQETKESFTTSKVSLISKPPRPRSHVHRRKSKKRVTNKKRNLNSPSHNRNRKQRMASRPAKREISVGCKNQPTVPNVPDRSGLLFPKADSHSPLMPVKKVGNQRRRKRPKRVSLFRGGSDGQCGSQDSDSDKSDHDKSESVSTDQSDSNDPPLKKPTRQGKLSKKLNKSRRESSSPSMSPPKRVGGAVVGILPLEKKPSSKDKLLPLGKEEDDEGSIDLHHTALQPFSAVVQLEADTTTHEENVSSGNSGGDASKTPSTFAPLVAQETQRLQPSELVIQPSPPPPVDSDGKLEFYHPPLIAPRCSLSPLAIGSFSCQYGPEAGGVNLDCDPNTR